MGHYRGLYDNTLGIHTIVRKNWLDIKYIIPAMLTRETLTK